MYSTEHDKTNSQLFLLELNRSLQFEDKYVNADMYLGNEDRLLDIYLFNDIIA